MKFYSLYASVVGFIMGSVLAPRSRLGISEIRDSGVEQKSSRAPCLGWV